MTAVQATTSAVPWRPTTFVRLVLVQTAMAVVVLGAAYCAGGRATVSDQVVWLDIAVLASVCSALANGLWLSSTRRAVGERRQQLIDDIEEDAPRDVVQATIAFAVPTLTLFHRRECKLIAGKDVVAATPADHLGSNRQPCRWCEP